MQKPLSYDTLGELDGGAAKAIINAAISEALHDLDDRGTDEQPRKVEILVTFKQMENGQVATRVEAAAKVPRRRTADHFGKITRDAKQQTGLLFQDLAPDNPDQRTLDELERP